ncbi:MAG TPA: holo-[acyl-carrier-protein] synthase [Flavobacteriales bacterium]|jgi:holo-[acyl-carrier protein] synthase|nr:holo-[acyl-carrier-protein] synthase [Flavobacteriales bacterium]
MIKGLGTDIVEVYRIAKKMGNQKFLDRTFTSHEQDYCNAQKYPAQHFAGRFCAKEAYMKALGTGWSSNADFKDIEIVHSSNHEPKIVLRNASKTLFEERGLKQVKLSISHTETIAMAVVAIM